MPHHLKNDCKNNGRLHKLLSKRRNQRSSFCIESSFPNLVTGVFVCNLHSQRLFVYENASFAHLRLPAVVASNFQLKYFLFEKNCKSLIHSSMCWPVAMLNQVLSLALKATWLSAGPWGGSFVLGSRVVLNVCPDASAYAVSI